MAQTTSITRVSRSLSPRHGPIFQPASRAWFAWLEGRLDPGALNQLESGKFFPLTESGLTDPLAPTDSANNTPPTDGQLASCGNSAALFLDDPRNNWKKHPVEGGATFVISWDYSVRHITRRWKYFITRNDWQPDQPLSRAQFEDLPFCQIELSLQPFWLYSDALTPPKPTEHELILPTRTGYHVLLAVWEVANTGNAFYQVLDLDFIDNDDDAKGRPPASPENLRLNTVSEKRITLSWSAASAGSWPVAQHRVYRDGVVTALIEAGENQYTDNSVIAGTRYTYFVTGVDANGSESKPSTSLSVLASSHNGPGDTPPTAPLDLYRTEITPSSVTLAWQPAISMYDLISYIVYRDGIEVGRTATQELGFIDTGLAPSTRYRYFVVALDSTGKLSAPSNVLATTTRSQNGDGESPQWAVGVAYTAGDIVIYNGKAYVCMIGHTAQTDWNPERAFTLWQPA